MGGAGGALYLSNSHFVKFAAETGVITDNKAEIRTFGIKTGSIISCPERVSKSSSVGGLFGGHKLVKCIHKYA